MHNISICSSVTFYFHSHIQLDVHRSSLTMPVDVHDAMCVWYGVKMWISAELVSIYFVF